MGRAANQSSVADRLTGDADPDPTAGCEVPFVFKCWALLCLYLWQNVVNSFKVLAFSITRYPFL